MLRRAGASGGAILAALLCASYVLGGPMPHAGTPPAQLIPFLAANSARQEWSWFLACGPVLVIGPWFAGVLTAHLWELNPAERHLTAAGFSTALTAGALLAAAGVMWGLFVYLGTQITSPSLVLVLAESRHFAEGAVGFPAAGAVIGYSLAARGHVRGWRAVVALGFLAAGLQLANGVDDFVVDGLTGFLGAASFATFLAWLVVISMALTAQIWAIRFTNPAAVSSAGAAALPAN